MRADQLSRQVEELIRARETEPEELLRQYQEAAEKTIEGIHPYIGVLSLFKQDHRPEEYDRDADARDGPCRTAAEGW